MQLGTRLLASFSLAMIVVTASAPHSRTDSILSDDSSDLIEPREIHVTGCERLPAGVTHLHCDRVREVDPCIACFLQHMRATGSKVRLGTPQILEHALAVIARVSHAQAIRLRKSSRGPPILAS